MKALTLSAVLAFGLTCSLQAQVSDHSVQILMQGDSLALCIPGESFTSRELEIHKLIWSIAEVRENARHLKTKGIKTLTMTDEKLIKDSKFYVIGLFEYLHDHLVRLDTYRVGATNKIEKYNVELDSWSELH